VDKHIELRYTAGVGDGGLGVVPDDIAAPFSVFSVLSFPPEAQIEKIVVTETTANTLTGGGRPTFTVDVFNSAAAEGEDAKVKSLYKVVPSQAGNSEVMELFLQSGGAYRNIEGGDSAPVNKIYVELTLTAAPAADALFDVHIGAVIPS
jgi:hypothetical protein